MKKLFTYIATLTISILIYTSCAEPYEPKTGTFEEALVIESTITNKLKKQIVKLSRVQKLESEFSNKENNAQVWVEANNTTYTFSETESGTYLSDIAFEALPDTEYNLVITTQNGKKYKSKPVFLTPEAPISNLYTQTETINNQLGAQIFVDNNNIGNAKYFRYEFDETYKIITPYVINRDISLYDITLLPYPYLKFKANISPTTIEKNICYITNTQQEIILSSLNNTSENNIRKFPIRFIANDDYLIRERYSILVKQYVQTFASHNFYKTLNKLQNIESLLAEVQTGFVLGNVFSKNNPKEMVVGFFNISTVSEKRIFFNYSNLNFYQPDYLYPKCTDVITANVVRVLNYNGRLHRQYILQYLYDTHPPHELLSGSTNSEGFPNTLALVPSECGNCSLFASNIRPDFWVD